MLIEDTGKHTHILSYTDTERNYYCVGLFAIFLKRKKKKPGITSPKMLAGTKCFDCLKSRVMNHLQIQFFFLYWNRLDHKLLLKYCRNDMKGEKKQTVD